MSPTKPRPAAARPRIQTRATSSIPRRAGSSSTTTRSKTKAAAATDQPKTILKAKALAARRTHDSVLNDPSNVGSSSNLFSGAARIHVLSDDKENAGVGSTRVLRSRFRAASPTKGKTGISKTASPSTTITRTKTRRVPLRELSDHEIFERDAAALGDLRRRRSGEHSGAYIEFETHHAPDPEVSNAMEMREASVLSSTTESTQTSAQTAITEPEPEPKEKIQVLRRTDSVESLQRKVEAIMAATATSTNTKATIKKRNLSHLRNKPLTAPHKLEHPAARSGSPIQDSPDAFANSPILTRRSVSPISKALPSPQRPVRIGLGVKSVNALLKEATKAVKTEAANGKKPVISASNAQSKTTVVKKTGISSLRRAAGTATRTRPTATTSVNSARSGLDAIRRMR